MICRTAVELICRSLDAPLSAGARVGLWVHTLLCGPCRRFRRQMLRLDAACAAAAQEGPPPGEERLSAVARERIVAALKNS